MFFAPFTPYFDTRIGRPSIPMETYLRMMFLKFRYRLGFEALCREVGDSISWQRFCRIPFGTRVPHPTTLMKLTTRCGDAAVAGLNEALLAKAADAKLLRTDKVRADTTVVEAAVAYPTDSGLLAKAVTTIARTITRIHNAGGRCVPMPVTAAAQRASGPARSPPNCGFAVRWPVRKLCRGRADHRGVGRHRRIGDAGSGRGAAQCPPGCAQRDRGPPGSAISSDQRLGRDHG
ncbi:transposase [Mycobacterium paragordonae]|uniref:Transposase n=1 Tax=Mycobacterium paragordonae TaxID=1389713 RepID=A0ABQ1CBC5_9MYCO|nr:transposase [Mycobacterium paragordonae]